MSRTLQKLVETTEIYSCSQRFKTSPGDYDIPNLEDMESESQNSNEPECSDEIYERQGTREIQD